MAKRKSQPGRKLVSVPNATYDALTQLRRELSDVHGQELTIGDVVARGVQCLRDAHSRNAWLSPAEQEEPLRDRLRTAVLSNLIALREMVPGLGLGEVQYDPANDVILVAVAGEDKPVPLYPDSPTAWAARRRVN